jgi:hypothetical protein
VHTQRWKEELVLVEEEMCCCLQFCEWKAKQWEGMQDSRVCTESATKVASTSALQEGLKAYALEHAFTEQWRAKRWEGHWEVLRFRAVEVLEAKLGKVEKDLVLEELPIELPSMPEELSDYIIADDKGDD